MNPAFAESPPGPAGYFSEDFGGYRLEGRVLRGREEDSAAAGPVFAIHGARSDYTRLNPLLFWLQGQGVGSLSFNLSGHGPSSPVPLHATSLARNLQEAERFHAASALPPPVVLGQSLGGALALKLAERHEASVRKLILICPAVYPEAAHARPFGPEFTAAISRPFGFLDSTSLRFLERYAGELLLVMGAYDGLRAADHGQPAGRSAGTVVLAGAPRSSVIPREVVDAIEGAMAPSRLRKILLPGCDHAVSRWLREDAARVDALGREVLDFLA
ncbi:alpha/beta fold hydrolase [Paracidovorax anthurii]|uniref:Pimeloyl-ACP methyl ester carboxylesterase n=1 Tax=Paracidovorax anthurii TaxID=78229 RepID=A0A328ZK38_9BURK|nr:alpha/beta hydrolase [Paracidovorax anthurii]RAR86518.1 pimeloyl-ACP methyl ester carboxylesterase [Paracidovorax anthurii]WCM93403.1 alpha/beta hydrolase [Acidovorax sp. NCPPB 2350]